MGFPAEDLPQFPVHAAEDLAAELDALTSKLEDAIVARARAGRNLPAFEGTVADEFRADLGRHETDVGDVIDRFRRTAGRLRDAVTEHEADRRRIMELSTSNVA